MYILGWIALVSVSLGLSLAAFAWALHTGQFADQGRARYLALEEEADASPEPAGMPPGLYALMAIGALVCLGLSAPVLLWALRLVGG